MALMALWFSKESVHIFRNARRWDGFALKYVSNYNEGQMKHMWQNSDNCPTWVIV